MRTVTLQFTSEDQLNLHEALTKAAIAGGADIDDISAQVAGAVHYLATWAMDSDRYQYCMITLNVREMEMIATYRATSGDCDPITYQIGAVWNGTAFGFHS